MQQLVSQLTGRLAINSFRQLLIPPKNDNACPFPGVRYFVHFNAGKRVGAQPFYLPADRGKTVDMKIVIGKVEWRDVGLGLVRAGNPAKAPGSQEVQASLPRKLFNVHGVSPGSSRNPVAHAGLA